MDRLSNLLDRFRLHVTVESIDQANLAVYRDTKSTEEFLIFQPRDVGIATRNAELLFSLHVDFGNLTNPLRTALPKQVFEKVQPHGDLANIVSLLISEQENNRCGAPAVLGRLGEVLVVRMLRMQLERGTATSGLLSGLADPLISKVIVAIHECPENLWRSSDLAAVAGLSGSRFKERFAASVGEAPMTYLRRWRMILARIDLDQGHRVDQVAHRYGYRAPDAFSRAFLKEFGERPRANPTKQI